MMPIGRVSGKGILCALVLSATAAAQLKGGFHEDPKAGFKIKVPVAWRPVPVGIDEKWIAAQYLSDREYVNKKGEFTMSHKPTLRVIVFTDEARKNRGLKVDSSGGDTTTVSLSTPYRDYQDYLKRNQSEGYYFFKEKTERYAGMDVQQYEVKIEKGATVPKRLVTWVYRRDDADYAVEFEVLEDHYDKLSPDCYAALKSFRFIAREAAVSSGTTGPKAEKTESGIELLWESSRKNWKALSAAERKKKRQAIEDARARKTTEGVPEGWKVRNSAHYLVVTHADEKSTQRVVDAAEACRSWVEKTFGDLNDEYVMKGIIRICADRDEYGLYVQGSGDTFSSGNREIVLYKDASMGSRSEYYGLFRYILERYLADKDSLLSFHMPPWIEIGLNQYVATAKVNGGKMEFAPDTYENDAIREATRKGGILTARRLMEMTSDEFYKGDYQSLEAQSGRLVRYFFGPGRNQKGVKDFLVEYLKTVAVVAEELDGESSPKEFKSADTEAEEEARFKERKESGKKQSKDLVTKVQAKICAWDQKQWDALERGFSAGLQ